MAISGNMCKNNIKKSKQCSIGARNRNRGQGYERRFVNKLKKRFKHIILFYDTDLTGISFMRKIKKQYPNLNFFFIPRKFKVKDLTDFVKKYGLIKTKEYVEQIKKRFE